MEARISPSMASKAASESSTGCSMYMRPAWHVTPGGAIRLKSCSTTVLVEGTMTPSFARQPTTSGMRASPTSSPCTRAGDRSPRPRRGRRARWSRRRPSDLLHDGADARVLPLLVEAHAGPRHDELVGRDVGGHEGLADVLGIGGLRAVDGVDEHGESGERAGGRFRDVTPARIVLLLLEELVDLADERLLAWRSRAKGERVICPSISLFISWTKAGSTQPAFWAMSILGM